MLSALSASPGRALLPAPLAELGPQAPETRARARELGLHGSPRRVHASTMGKGGRGKNPSAASATAAEDDDKLLAAAIAENKKAAKEQQQQEKKQAGGGAAASSSELPKKALTVNEIVQKLNVVPCFCLLNGEKNLVGLKDPADPTMWHVNTLPSGSLKSRLIWSPSDRMRRSRFRIHCHSPPRRERHPVAGLPVVISRADPS